MQISGTYAHRSITGVSLHVFITIYTHSQITDTTYSEGSSILVNKQRTSSIKITSLLASGLFREELAHCDLIGDFVHGVAHEYVYSRLAG